MEGHERLAEQIWREVSQSASGTEIVQGVSDLVAEHLQHRQLVLVRLDVDHERLVVVESIDRGEDPGDRPARDWTIGTGEAFQQLLEWCRQERTTIRRVDEIGGAFERACPWPAETRVLLVSLSRNAGQVGFAAARLSGADPESRETRETVAAISEPLSAALHYEQGLGDATAASVERPGLRREHYQRVKRRELVDVIMDARTGLGDVVEWVRRVAPSNEPILLIGETGTGKEVIARTIHNNSEYANGPLLRVNCGALSEGILETKLFGGGEEEYTPVSRRKAGWFERAEGGTLFLDEIDKLSPDAQRRLSDWIATGELDRPDEAGPLAPELRLVAANHTALKEIETFDEALLEHLSTFPIRIPPLRARPEDIPALALRFAEKVGRRIGGAPLAPSDEEIEMLVDYDWPGNIRELRTVIERAAIIGNGKRLHIRRALGDVSEQTDTEPEADGQFPTLEEAVRRHLLEALRETDGQVAGEGGAADLLDMHPSTLRSKLKRHELDPGDYR